MRWGLISWVGFGIAMVSLKAYADISSTRYPDVVVGSGPQRVHIPRALILSEGGWRADVFKIVGCWDRRSALVSTEIAYWAGCLDPRPLTLELPNSLLGVQREYAPAFRMTYWVNYGRPSDTDLREAVSAWSRKEQWRGARVVYNDAWQRFAVSSSETPWVILFSAEPRSTDETEIARHYAGKCYKPDSFSDIGVTCTFVQRHGVADAVEYSLGLDDMQYALQVQAGVSAVLSAWTRH